MKELVILAVLGQEQGIEILNVGAKGGEVAFRAEKTMGPGDAEAYIANRRVITLEGKRLQQTWVQQAQGLVTRDKKRSVVLADVRLPKEGAYRVEMGEARAYVRVSRQGFAGWEKMVQGLFGMFEELNQVALDMDQAPAHADAATSKGWQLKLGAIRRRWKPDMEFAASCLAISDAIVELGGCPKMSGLVQHELPKGTSLAGYDNGTSDPRYKKLAEELKKAKPRTMADVVKDLQEVITREAVLYLLDELELVVGAPGPAPVEAGSRLAKPKNEMWIIRWPGFDAKGCFQTESELKWLARWSSRATPLRQITDAYRSMRVKYEIGDWFDLVRDGKDPEPLQTLKEWRTRLLTLAIH